MPRRQVAARRDFNTLLDHMGKWTAPFFNRRRAAGPARLLSAKRRIRSADPFLNCFLGAISIINAPPAHPAAPSNRVPAGLPRRRLRGKGRDTHPHFSDYSPPHPSPLVFRDDSNPLYSLRDFDFANILKQKWSPGCLSYSRGWFVFWRRQAAPPTSVTPIKPRSRKQCA